MKNEPNKGSGQQDNGYKSRTDQGLFYVWFISGILIFLVGLFLIINNGIATGVTSADDMGMGYGRPTYMPGYGAIVIGLLALTYSLIFRKTTKR
jgi:hypothetical protein